MGNGQISGKTLSVSSQDLETNTNTPGLRVGGVTDGIRERSCDHRSRPTPCIAYSCLRMLHDEVLFDVPLCTDVLSYGRHCV